MAYYDLVLKLAQTETPEKIADRIMELYETIEEQEANIEQLSYCDDLPQSAEGAAQPVITLQYTDRREAIRALRVDDYAIALERIRDAIRSKLKYEELGDEAYDVLDDLWMSYHVTVEDLPEEL